MEVIDSLSKLTYSGIFFILEPQKDIESYSQYKSGPHQSCSYWVLNTRADAKNLSLALP